MTAFAPYDGTGGARIPPTIPGVVVSTPIRTPTSPGTALVGPAVTPA
ncbi:hypothetical protein [Gordonia humi]